MQWTTLQQAAGAVVQYGTASGQYTGSANATFDTYTASEMCGGEAATTGYLFPGKWHNFCPTAQKQIMPVPEDVSVQINMCQVLHVLS